MVVLVVTLWLVLISKVDKKKAKRWTLIFVLWLATTAGIAATGILRKETLPPPWIAVVLPALVGAVVLATREFGKTLLVSVPLWALIALQGFRLPLELVMHRAYQEGIMPVQMSYSGRNFDILTGVFALILAFFITRINAPSTWLLWIWNTVGFVLLLNVVIVAILSTPTPFRVFMNEPANIWITYPPFIWLPTFLVPSALFGHLLFFRYLLGNRQQSKAKSDLHTSLV